MTQIGCMTGDGFIECKECAFAPFQGSRCNSYRKEKDASVGFMEETFIELSEEQAKDEVEEK